MDANDRGERDRTLAVVKKNLHDLYSSSDDPERTRDALMRISNTEEAYRVPMILRTGWQDWRQQQKGQTSKFGILAALVLSVVGRLAVVPLELNPAEDEHAASRQSWNQAYVCFCVIACLFSLMEVMLSILATVCYDSWAVTFDDFISVNTVFLDGNLFSVPLVISLSFMWMALASATLVILEGALASSMFGVCFILGIFTFCFCFRVLGVVATRAKDSYCKNHKEKYEKLIATLFAEVTKEEGAPHHKAHEQPKHLQSQRTAAGLLEARLQHLENLLQTTQVHAAEDTRAVQQDAVLKQKLQTGPDRDPGVDLGARNGPSHKLHEAFEATLSEAQQVIKEAESKAEAVEEKDVHKAFDATLGEARTIEKEAEGGLRSLEEDASRAFQSPEIKSLEKEASSALHRAEVKAEAEALEAKGGFRGLETQASSAFQRTDIKSLEKSASSVLQRAEAKANALESTVDQSLDPNQKESFDGPYCPKTMDNVLDMIAGKGNGDEPDTGLRKIRARNGYASVRYLYGSLQRQIELTNQRLTDLENTMRAELERVTMDVMMGMLAKDHTSSEARSDGKPKKGASDTRLVRPAAQASATSSNGMSLDISSAMQSIGPPGSSSTWGSDSSLRSRV